MPYLPHRNIQPVPTVELFVKGGTAPLLPAPVLSNPDNDNLAWTYSPDPFSFSLQNSVDGVTNWGDFDVPAGSDRAYFGVQTNSFYRIFAVDINNHPISLISNVVFVP